MNLRWLEKFFTRAAPREIVLSAAQRQAIDAWQQLPASASQASHYQSRYVVADVETSGLNMQKDSLISIGAVAVVNGQIDFHDVFEVVLRQDEVSTHANILLHGIGGLAQREGVAPPDALIAFLRYLGKAPLVAYHALFDQTMIERAMQDFLGVKFGQQWIDLAWVMPELFREHIAEQVGLDDWIAIFGIENIQRHNAVSDAYATAKLLQTAIARGMLRGAPSPGSFVDIEKARRWRRAELA